MKYIESITDFFKSPKWVMNLLFSGLCIIVVIVGWIALLGWHITGFWARNDERPETFPDFDPAQLSKYFERGIWPVLVGLAASVALKLITWFPVMLMGKIFGGLGAIFASLVMVGVNLVLAVVLMFVMIPVVIRAILTQDFVKAFDLPFIKRFLSLMFVEMVICSIFMTVAGFALSLAGAVALCVGIPFGIGLAWYASSHLYRQLYNLYLARGGEPVPVSPKLTNEPPPAAPLPPVAPPAA